MSFFSRGKLKIVLKDVAKKSAPSDMEIETETSAETDICNNSIDLSTKKYFSEAKKK